MKQLPADVIPAGLLKSHNTKAGVWGKIIILGGELRYRILEPQLEDHVLTTEKFGVVEPQVLHEVMLLGKASFYVEFLK